MALQGHAGEQALWPLLNADDGDQIVPIRVRSVCPPLRSRRVTCQRAVRASALQVLDHNFGNACATLATGRAAFRVFRQLTGGEGDADLLLTMDKQVVFTEGILMSVRCARLHSLGAA